MKLLWMSGTASTVCRSKPNRRPSLLSNGFRVLRNGSWRWRRGLPVPSCPIEGIRCWCCSAEGHFTQGGEATVRLLWVSFRSLPEATTSLQRRALVAWTEEQELQSSALSKKPLNWLRTSSHLPRSNTQDVLTKPELVVNQNV